MIMAKGFQETDSLCREIVKDAREGVFKPVYLLMGDARLVEGLRRAEVGGIHGSGFGRGGDQEEATVQGEAEGQQEQGESQTKVGAGGSGLHGVSPFECFRSV